MSPISKILAIKLRALGDTVLLTAPLKELIQLYPQAKIDVLVPHSWAEIIRGMPGINQVWTFPTSHSKIQKLKATAQLAYLLRREKYDCALNFHASPSSARLALATGAPIRSIHFHGHRDINKYSTVIVPGKGTLKPIIERDMDTIRALGVHVPAGRLPTIPLQKFEREKGAVFLNQLNLPPPILGLSIGSSRPSKSWPIEHFAVLAVEWAHVEKGGVLALAGPHEEKLIHAFLSAVDDHLSETFPQSQEVRTLIRKKIATSHQLSVRSLAEVLSQLAVLAGNDSGPKHLAVAVNTPTVTFFGPENPFEWHPYPVDRNPYLFIDNLPCRKDAAPGMPSWCGIPICIKEDHKCMRLIGVDSAIAQCRKVAKK